MTAIDDVTKLSVMRDAIQYILKSMSEETKDSLKKDRKLQLSVVKDLESIGGAAKRVSVGCQQRYPQIPWQGMVEMWNRLSSPYLGIDIDVVWRTVQDDLEPLLVAIEVALHSEQKR
jgi:uncharacterized protein with HEPN domain